MDKSTILSLIAIVVIVGAGSLIFRSPVLNPFSPLNPINPINPVACSQEAKLCPDGSAVGRTGPNCEFALCPDVQTKEGTTAVLNQRILNRGVYITPLQIVSDSRCPVGVQCIWAGEISIKVRLEKNEVKKEVELKEGGFVVFEGNGVFFVNVIPENKTKPTTPVEDYRFTFKVSSIDNQGTVQGMITLSPTCPVEHIPPDPNCAPKPYSTSINIIKTGSTQVVKTIQSDSSGAFSVDLVSGAYVLQAQGGNVLPRCGEVLVEVKSDQNTVVEISCDTGIR